MAQSISQEAIGATGLPGATAASRYAGATASGAPTTGTFAVGDFVVDQTGAIYICTVAGTPGTWVLTKASNITGTLATANGGTGLSTIGTAGQVLTVNSGATALQYSTPTVTTSVTMGGDVTGASGSSTVAKINGTTLGTLSGATSGQALAWNGSAWAPTTISGGAPGTTVQSFISTSVSVGAAGTYYPITSISLTAGTWLINYQADFTLGSDSTTLVIISTGASAGTTTQPTGIIACGSGSTGAGLNVGSATACYSYVVASTTTVYLSGAASSTGTINGKSGYMGSNGINITGITAVRTA